jgi:hypothetical protein
MWCGNWSPTVINNINWIICEQGTEETFNIKAERVTESGGVLFFIVFSRYYHGEQIHVNKLDRSSRIHYKGINTYKIVVKKLEKTGLS